MTRTYFCIFTLSTLLCSNNVLAIDSNDFDTICEDFRAEELELLKLEVAEGYMTEEEMANEIALMPDDEQCVCFFEQLLENAGEKYTQLVLDNEISDYTEEEWQDKVIPALPDGVDPNSLVETINKACGITTE